MVPSGIIFQSCFSVPLGSGAFLINVFLATCFLLFSSTEVLSPKVMLNLSGVILIGDICLHLAGIEGPGKRDRVRFFVRILRGVILDIQIGFAVQKIPHRLLVEHWAVWVLSCINRISVYFCMLGFSCLGVWQCCLFMCLVLCRSLLRMVWFLWLCLV